MKKYIHSIALKNSCVAKYSRVYSTHKTNSPMVFSFYKVFELLAKSESDAVHPVHVHSLRLVQTQRIHRNIWNKKRRNKTRKLLLTRIDRCLWASTKRYLVIFRPRVLSLALAFKCKPKTPKDVEILL